MMKITEPKIESREAQPTVGIRTQVPMQKFPEIIPRFIDEMDAWLTEQGVNSAGAPYIRYHVINMENDMDIEIGFPVENALKGDDRVTAGVIPAGRYGTLIYTDVNKGIEGNSVLIGWAKDNGIEWDAWDSEAGHAFASRIEYMLDGPDDDPNPANWRTEVAIRVVDTAHK